jgi:hypothetical protein
MSLTERDRLDLAALASGLGDAQSDIRAHQLMEADPKAAEFVRQIKSICGALHADSEAETPALSSEEADTIPARILARARRRQFGVWFFLSHPWRWGIVAATIMLTIGTWLVFDRRMPPIVAEAVFISESMRLSPIRTRDPRHAQIRAGQLVETRGEQAVLTLVNQSRVVAVQETNLIIRATGQTIDLQRGDVFIQAVTTVEVQVSQAVVRVDAGSLVMIRVGLHAPACAVYTGRALVTQQGQDTLLTTGKQCAWDELAGGVHVASLSTEPPQRIKNALNTPAEP